MIHPNTRKNSSAAVAQSTLTDYSDRVTLSGGTLSGSDVDVLKLFVTTLAQAGIWNKIVDCSFIGFGGFAGCLNKTKYASSSFKEMLNTGFVSGDYSVSGLLSSVSTKYLDTQIVPGLYGLNRNDFSMGCYMAKDVNTSLQYLMGDNEVSGRGRVLLTKGNLSIISDSGATNISRTLCGTNVDDPHFVGFSMGTNIRLMEGFQQVLGSDTSQVAVTSNALTLDTNIRLLRGRDSGGEVGGAGQIAFYWIGHELSYAEMTILQQAVKAVLIAKAAITDVNEVCCVGDSITFGQQVTMAQRYSTLLATALSRREINFGIPSSVLRVDNGAVPSLFSRYTQLANTNYLNSRFHFQYGVNDYNYGAGVTSKYITIIEYLLNLGVPTTSISIGSPSPVNTGVLVATQTGFRDAVEDACQATGVYYAPVYDKIMDNGGYATNITGDQIHLNAAGHILVADCIENDLTLIP
jgi:hypothetical protein